MNNLVSLLWLKDFVDISVSESELAKRLSLVGVGVEYITHLGSGLDKIVVGVISLLEKHPNADTLTVCQVDVGYRTQIVCGGSNLYVGQRVAVALPGSHVKWHGEGEPVEITLTKLRGVESAGMICASNEIGLGTILPAAGEREIVDLNFVKAKPGTPLARALALSDTIFEIEATTNRVDLMSIVGVAREAVAARAATVKKQKVLKLPRAKSRVAVSVSDKKLCPRYIAARIDGVVVGESPMWLKQRLASAGVHSVNNIVDITNYVRLELGQPMHAFDANVIQKKITVRRARAGENFVALDASQHKLDESMLVIADDAHVLAVAGVMGGKESGVFVGTTSIIFEAASFNNVSVRKTARTLNLSSDSQKLFEKGLSTQAPEPAMARAVQLALEIAGGTLTALTDEKPAGTYKPVAFPFDFTRVADFVGQSIPLAEMKRILQSLGFVIKGKTVVAPWWRDHDIESSVDFIEEIARVYGYHNLPSRLPSGQVPDRAVSPELVAEHALREHFKACGYNEVYAYSFVSEVLLAKAAYEHMPVVTLQNPLTVDLAVMRPSLVPGMLQVIAENEAQFSEGAIFEVSNVYAPLDGSRPLEQLNVCAAVWSSDKKGEQFFELKGAAEQLLRARGIENVFGAGDDAHLHPGRQLSLRKNDIAFGFLGEVHPLILKNFGISGRVAIFNCAVSQLIALSQPVKTFVPPPTFPPAKRDVAFVVNEEITYESLAEFFTTFDLKLSAFELFDIYRGTHVGDGKKSMAFHLTYSASDRTLESAEVDELHDALTKSLVRDFGAVMRA